MVLRFSRFLAWLGSLFPCRDLLGAPPAGSMAKEWSRTPLTGGADSNDLCLYRYGGSGEPPGDLPPAFVAKRTSYRQEVDLARLMLVDRRSCGPDGPLLLFPEIFGVARAGRSYLIHMEYLGRCGKPDVMDAEFPRALAKAIVRLQLVLPGMAFRLGPCDFRQAFTTTNLAQLGRLARILGKPLAQFQKLDSMCAAIAAIPPVFSHSDLSWGNISCHHCATSWSIRFIDFAWITFLPAGAEFHHLAAYAHVSGEDGWIFDATTAAYGDLLGLPSPLIRLAAYIFAIHICLHCAYHKQMPKQGDQKAAGVWRETGRLCAEALREWSVYRELSLQSLLSPSGPVPSPWGQDPLP